MNTHNAFKCNKCDHTFKKEGELKRHMNSHTGEKSFKCSKCDNSYTIEAELNFHMRNHTEETFIDRSFAETVKSPKNFESTPIRQNSPISASQPCSKLVKQESRKNKRGISLSPESIQNVRSYKKAANEKCVKSSYLKHPSVSVKSK